MMSLEFFGYVLMPALIIAMALSGYGIIVRRTPRPAAKTTHFSPASQVVAAGWKSEQADATGRIFLGARFQPLHDRVVVKRLSVPFAAATGVVIPDAAKDKPREGEIVAVGPGGRDENGKRTPLGVKAGDKVLFDEWSGAEVKIEGEDLLILKESDITGIIAR